MLFRTGDARRFNRLPGFAHFLNRRRTATDDKHQQQTRRQPLEQLRGVR